MAWHGVVVDQLGPGELTRLAGLLRVLEDHPVEGAATSTAVLWAAVGEHGQRKRPAWRDGTMAVGDLDAHAHAMIGLMLQRLSQDHDDGDVAVFLALHRAWLGWAGELHCPACERRLLEAARGALAAAQQRRLH